MRQQGQTTKQMLAAPFGAIYIWPNSQLDYPQALARSLGRNDLVIVSPSFLREGNIRGRRYPGAVVDHAAWSAMNYDHLMAHELLTRQSALETTP